MSFEAQDLVFRARALAQTHPLTPMASRFVNRAIAQERADQPFPEVGVWAGSALIDGYCLRRVEEAEGDGESGAVAVAEAIEAIDGLPAEALDRLEEIATHIAFDLRTGSASGCADSDHEERTIAALDRLVASAVERRLDHLRDDVDGQAWAELGEYLAWWVVKGYALRVAEC